MSHPEEFLAGYVDGTLSAKERVSVESHLASCPDCRAEVPLARRAVSLLSAVPEEEVPLGVTAPVLDEVRGERVSARGGDAATRPSLAERRYARWQWAAGAVAAVLVLVLVVPNVFRSGDSKSTGGAQKLAEARDSTGVGAAAPGGSGLLGPGILEDQGNTNYDTNALTALAQEVAVSQRSAAREAPPVDLSDDATANALRCLQRGSQLPADQVPFRLIRARFQGTPAVIGLFLSSPGAGLPASSVEIWVVARDGCRVLSFTSQRI